MAQIYIITNKLNNKQYVGVTDNSLEIRWKSHCYDYNVVSKAIKKHGKDNFTIEPLLECSSMDEAYDLEPVYIIKHKTKFPNGYNISDGGKGSQVGKRKPTPDDVKQKISESVKQNHYWDKLTEEQKEKIRESWRENNKSRTGQKRGPYNQGLFKKTVWINNGNKRKRIPAAELNTWIANGWHKGHMKGLTL
jgi:group I intron endonuclease